jgi:small subunit ribosomal protein S5
VKVGSVSTTRRGGRQQSFRSLVVGGNANGCAGFGLGKALSAPDATKLAIRQSRRNIFFVERYAGCALTTNLAGKHNSCKVTLLAVPPGYGLHGNPLICEILKYFGIADCTAKAHGNRNSYNVVYATFKALTMHESLEEVAMKRGKRLMTLQRMKRLNI